MPPGWALMIRINGIATKLLDGRRAKCATTLPCYMLRRHTFLLIIGLTIKSRMKQRRIEMTYLLYIACHRIALLLQSRPARQSKCIPAASSQVQHDSNYQSASNQRPQTNIASAADMTFLLFDHPGSTLSPKQARHTARHELVRNMVMVLGARRIDALMKRQRSKRRTEPSREFNLNQAAPPEGGRLWFC
jgi:hypothetical protein